MRMAAQIELDFLEAIEFKKGTITLYEGNTSMKFITIGNKDLIAISETVSERPYDPGVLKGQFSLNIKPDRNLLINKSLDRALESF